MCAQTKMKQLQADIDCILKACYAKDGEGGGAGCTKDSRKPDCNAMEVKKIHCCAYFKHIA